MPTRILGLSAYYHDSSACLVEDGRIVAAAQEERFTRKKHDANFPSRAVRYCLREAGIDAAALDLVGFYEKPLVKFERLLETYVACAPKGLKSYLMAMPLWLGHRLWMADDIKSRVEGYEGEVLFGDHHESHAASAFYPSPFEQAAVVTIDGVGEWATSSIGVGRGNDLDLLRELRFPHSLGLLYSAFTYFTGFRVNSGEYKLMGLAPYGEPKYVDTIKDHLLQIGDDGSLWMNMEYFEYPHALRMTGPGFERLFGGPAREPETRLTQREMDLARSVQDVTEEVMLKMARFARRETGMHDLCLAGGVALNCVANGRIAKEEIFDQIWIQPAAGDAGGAIGVALSLWHRHLGRPRLSPEASGAWERPERPAADRVRTAIPRYADGMSGAYLGPRFSDSEIEGFLEQHGCVARRLDRPALAQAIAALMAEEKVVGLLQGRMEFGPRALGGRSIIGDPRSPRMQSTMNLKIKFRESFRPFAPSVLREQVAAWFELDGDSPYMLLVAPVHSTRRLPSADESRTAWGIDRLNVPRSTVPAITHVDYSARIQTVRRETNPFYYDIIDAFYRLTGCPMIVNTSFNVRGEPIVCTPEDAYRCFMRTNIDALVLENHLLLKPEQAAPRVEDDSWRKEFVLD
jgi:carbamoyltransferase